MKRFKNILVIVREESNLARNLAVERAIDLARANKAKLTVMDIVDSPKALVSQFNAILKPDEIAQALLKKRTRTLTELADELADDIDVSVVVKVGKGFLEIIRRVVLEEHDLLIKMANNQQSNFDSSDFHLMRKSPCPVWLLKAEGAKKCEKILATIDLNLESDEQDKTLNHAIMQLANSLAKMENSELHMLSCWSLYGEEALRHSSFSKISDEELQELITNEEKAYAELQSEIIARYEGVTIHPHLIKAHPADAIPKFASENAIDTVVMGTVARSGIPGFFIGNTAETILHGISASVITLKPQGFETPIV